MIVSQQADRLRLVTQTDHAHLAGEILSLMRLPGLIEHPRRPRLLRAVREHDNGWREVDAAPRVVPGTGRPHDYRTLPDTTRREVWDRGIHRFIGDDPYVALLVCRHALALHRDRSSEETWEEWIEALGALAADLFDECQAAIEDLTSEQVADDSEWLSIADGLSLAVCEGRDGDRLRVARFDLRVEGTTLRLDPFPLAGATTFRLSCRHLPDRRYRDDRDLGSALARSRWDRVDVKLAPEASVPAGAPW